MEDGEQSSIAETAGEERDIANLQIANLQVAFRSRRISWWLNWYLGREVLKIFGFVFLLIELGYALLASIVVARKFDVDIFIVLPVLWRIGLSMLNDSMPIALLFASGLAYGRFVADKEVLALKSFGLSYKQLLMPLVLIGGAMSFIGFGVVGFLAPEMNYSKGFANAQVLSDGLRYLGEGWNRSVPPFGNYSLWITHYDGRRLEGIRLKLHSSKDNGSAKNSMLPEEISPRAAETFFIYAETARILFPEEIQGSVRPAESLDELAEDVREERPIEVAEVEPGQYAPGTIIFRLQNVRFFFSNAFFNKGEPSPYLHQANLDYFDFPYSPAGLLPTVRRPKQLMMLDLLMRMRSAGTAASLPDANDHQIEVASELETEFYWRWARIASFFLYPVLAGLVALFMNAENRYMAFFVSCLIVPTTFYGMGAVGQQLTSVPAWLAMGSGTFLLLLLLGVGVFYLDRKPVH